MKKTALAIFGLAAAIVFALVFALMPDVSATIAAPNQTTDLVVLSASTAATVQIAATTSNGHHLALATNTNPADSIATNTALAMAAGRYELAPTLAQNHANPFNTANNCEMALNAVMVETASAAASTRAEPSSQAESIGGTDKALGAAEYTFIGDQAGVTMRIAA